MKSIKSAFNIIMLVSGALTAFMLFDKRDPIIESNGSTRSGQEYLTESVSKKNSDYTQISSSNSNSQAEGIVKNEMLVSGFNEARILRTKVESNASNSRLESLNDKKLVISPVDMLNDEMGSVNYKNQEYEKEDFPTPPLASFPYGDLNDIPPALED